MKIVDASITDLKAAPRGRRQRSPETQALIEAILSLKSGQAKAVVPENKETVKQLRARVSYAARAADRKLRIVADDSQVMFALRTSARGSGSTASRAGAAQRKDLVQKKALDLGKRRKSAISAQDIIEALTADGVDLGVARPGTMVGAVLRSMPEFERTGHNQFKYAG
jgi:hypothetical protein